MKINLAIYIYILNKKYLILNKISLFNFKDNNFEKYLNNQILFKINI